MSILSEAPPVTVTAPCVFGGDCGLPSVALATHSIGDLAGTPRPLCLPHVQISAASLAFQPGPEHLPDHRPETLRVEWLVAR